mgnify:CR=1 FL=1
MKWFLAAGLLDIFAMVGVLLFAPISSQAAPVKPECSYPCGTISGPTSVQAPVSLGVQKNDDVDEYAFIVHTAEGVLVEQSKSTPSNSYTTKNVTGKGTYKWYAVAKNEEGENASAPFYFKVTKVCPAGSVCIQNPLTTEKFTDVVDRILNILFFVAIAVAPVMILIAGFRFLTGGGNPETLKGARQMLIWTAVGFGIILLSKGIVMILRGVIGF